MLLLSCSGFSEGVNESMNGCLCPCQPLSGRLSLTFFCSVAAGIDSNPFRGNVGIANGWMDGWVLDCWLYKNKLHRDAYVCSLFSNIVCCLLKGRIENCIQRKTRLINRENNGKLQHGRALCATMPLSLIVDSGKDALDFHDPFFSMQLLVVCRGDSTKCSHPGPEIAPSMHNTTVRGFNSSSNLPSH